MIFIHKFAPSKNKITMALQITNPTTTLAWQKLQKHFQEMHNVSMSTLFDKDQTRTSQFHIQWNDFLIDYSKNIIFENFKITNDVDIKWVTHPNWFFRISKFTLPLLKSEFVPQSFFLSDLKEYPIDLENYVLKPLFSFAGSGVKLNFTKEELDAIPDRENYLIQRKVKYEPIIEDKAGNLIKTEIRMLFTWEDNALRPKLVTNLARLSRGEMIGVNFNKNFDWVGGSCAFFED